MPLLTNWKVTGTDSRDTALVTPVLFPRNRRGRAPRDSCRGSLMVWILAHADSPASNASPIVPRASANQRGSTPRILRQGVCRAINWLSGSTKSTRMVAPRDSPMIQIRGPSSPELLTSGSRAGGGTLHQGKSRIPVVQTFG